MKALLPMKKNAYLSKANKDNQFRDTIHVKQIGTKMDNDSLQCRGCTGHGSNPDSGLH